MTEIEPLQRQSSRLRMFRPLLWTALFFISAIPCVQAQLGTPEQPMQPVVQDGAEFRWLNKKVLDSRLLDGMEDLSHWSFKGEGTMSLSDTPVKDGKHSIRISSTFNIARVNGSGEWEDLVATRTFLPRIGVTTTESLSGSTRISMEPQRFLLPWSFTTKAYTSCQTALTRDAMNPSR